MRQLAIHNPFNAPVFYEEIVSSTMDIARFLAARGEPHGTVITADFQKSGRGRIPERPWDMEQGTTLPFTVLLRYPRIENIPRGITLRTGLAVVLAIEDFIPALSGMVLIKWPNDIMIRINETDVKKAAGILTEAASGIVLAGIGINIAQKKFPPSLRDKAVSLGLASGTDIDGETRFLLLEKILNRLYDELKTAHNTGGTHDDWRSRLTGRLYKKGEIVCFAAGPATSPHIVEGRLEGIGSGGELLIVPKGENEARSFLAGELRVYSCGGFD